MAKSSLLYYLGTLLLTLSVWGQENAIRNLSPSLQECYENKFLLQRDNRLPHTLNTFVSILRKIENSEGFNMDLRTLSIALLHRFRQDGIVPNPEVSMQDGVTPYGPFARQFYRHAETLKLIPGDARQFPNNSITNVERCTLHFMLSSSIEIFHRGDEAKVCRYANAYRYPRSVSDHDDATSKGTNDAETDDDNAYEAETLTPDELETKSNPKDERNKDTVDPNSLYPELPPKNPKLRQLPQSKCPVENGVIKTPWGVVSPGLVLSAIAAATEPQTTVKLQDVQSDLLKEYNTNMLSDMTIDNKWFATLAGDLAEVALIQGPTKSKVSVGTTGHWNSTALPRWYFLDSNETFEMTTAEIRGDLDGLILANEITKLYSNRPSLRLSQVFDMYYSERGLFEPSIRACNRRTLFTAVASNETMTNQTYSAAVLLHPNIAAATLDLEKMKQFSVQAVNDLITYVPSSMNMDLTCEKTDSLNDFRQANVDLTIILDTTWAFSAIQPILATLLDGIELNQFNSNFTLINGHDGTEIINSTFSILDFYAYNSSHYDNITHSFDLPKSIDKVQQRLEDKLNNERNRSDGGARSDIVLIIPYISAINDGDKDYCLGKILRMREQIPDTTFLIMAYGSKDTWSEFVKNPATDLFTIGIGDTEDALSPITNLISRIKQVPKRLINTQCGSNYVSTGQSNAYVDYVPPNGVNLYRLHPNYFFKPDGSATVKIQGSSLDNLTICSAREPLHANATQIATSKTCVSVTGEAYNVTISCADTTFIHECPPLYLSVTANSTSLSASCTDRQKCRFLTSIKYTISYEDLTCVSGASKIAFNSLILIVLLTFLNL
ncbi:uncharacterized protein LOC143356563 [Halictus rubicundus]|uniref:uncharacterized protein LOC143356563 n=1 Tax=Halictus rubicundus TaxID=77578 RepID=UPI004036BBDE